MSTDPNFIQGLHNLLVQSTANDTNLIKSATAELNTQYYKKPACIPALAAVLSSSPEISVRQLAAVELRKRIASASGDLWTQVPQNEREQIKEKLPELILNESNTLVRHSAARVVGEIAGIELPLNTWPSLFPFVLQACQSQAVSHREVGSFMLFTVLENSIEGFSTQLNDLFVLFSQLINDPESLEVRITTVKSMGTVAQYMDVDDKQHIASFRSLLPNLIQVIGQAIESGDETGARQLFDVIETLLILEVPVLGKHIPQLAEFLLTCGANREYAPELRVLSLNALNWTVQYKKSKIQSNNLAGAILNGLMPIASEEEPEDADDDAPSRSALRIIDSLSTQLPPNQVFPALRDLIRQYFSSPDANQRRGAMLALGIAVEGCSEYMTPLMNEVWPVIEVGLRDPDASVRKATCVGVSCLCEWLEEQCAERHAVLLPALMTLVDDPATQRAACTALDALLEIMSDVIDQYLPLIMERLTGLLQSAPINVKSVVTGAIGSAAHASKEKFLPYFQPTMDKLQHFLVLTGEGEETELRGLAMDAVGTFADAVGKEVFRPYFPDMMKQAVEGIELGRARLRECSFLFFGVMARVFEDEFAQYLSVVVPYIITSLKQDEHGDEGITISDPAAAAAFASGSSPSDAITVTAETDVNGNPQVEIEDLDLDKLLDVNSAVAVEKEIAADTIGTIFAATKNFFLPYVENCTLELVALVPHYYEGIRKSATDSLLEIIRTFYQLSDHEDWEPGVPSITPLASTVNELIGHIFPVLMEMYQTEDDKGVVAGLCAGLAETINELGPAFIDGRLEEIYKIAVQVLEQKSLCQQDPDQDENDDDAPENAAEYDSVLISSAGDLVSSLANVMGADFVQLFGTFYPLISKYYRKDRSLSDRSSAIGCLAEVIAGMKAAVTPSTEPLLELFYRALSDPDPEVRSNAAFAAGLLVENSTVDLSPQYLHLLQALQPFFLIGPDASAAELNARDNAAGAVARLILRNTQSVPLEQVLPALIEVLPLKADLLENRPVFRALFHLFRSSPQSLYPHMDKLLAVFAHVLDPNAGDQIPEETRKELIELISVLSREDPAKIQAAGLAPYVQGA